MDCATASPFVSTLHDGGDAPDDVVRHVDACPRCQAQLRESAEIAAHLRLTAAVDRLDPLPPLELPAATGESAPRTSNPWRGLLTAVRVPRFAAALVTAALVVSTVGWIRAYTADRTVTEFHFDVSTACTFEDGSGVESTGSTSTVIGSETTFFTSDPCRPGDIGIYAFAHPVEIRDGIVTLRLHAWSGPMEARRTPEVPRAAIVEYAYVPGQIISIPVPGGPPVSFTATIRERGITEALPASLEGLLPGADELSIRMPALLRDGESLVVRVNAGASVRAGDVVSLYAPGSGLFVFGLQPFEGASSGQAAGATIAFESGGRSYVLYSSLPVTGGEHPREIWVRHLPDYRPAAGRDELPGLMNGAPEGVVR